ncbi:DUF4259 domain-containing protein [Nocardiopsis halophila]|uniref:DUF4259 domain-containing protein n=1 Tax=Nocardiopsis halophila TaxID=141692 RepID=UPI000349227C|nr:DUF4259 domain-containing protein [Nocardiopsis halophila]
MGTWGTGPYDNDTADDFLDELEGMASGDRLLKIVDTFRAAIAAEGRRSSAVLPEEVLAAGGVVAANLSPDLRILQSEDHPGIDSWLDGSASRATAALAVEALQAAFGENGRFCESWVDGRSRTEAEADYRSLLAVLRSA